MPLNKLHPQTLAIHGSVPASANRENSTALYLNSSFNFASAEDAEAVFNQEKEAYLYSRFSNPNTDELAQRMAALEGAEAAICVASGMSSVFNSLMAFLKAGDHMISAQSVFGNSLNIVCDYLPRWGINYTLASVDDFKNIRALIQANTKVLFLESPTNPGLRLIDIAAVAEVCKENGIIFIVDNCFATPILQRPIEHGADLVLHSATKFIDGQGRVLGGIITGKKALIKECFQLLRRTGPSLSPFNALILSKSIETLALRMKQHCEGALYLAEKLEKHPMVKQVWYPGLPSHPDYAVYKKQMDAGGALVAFEIMGDKKVAMSVMNRLKLFRLTANLGDTRSIITHPASTTHSRLNDAALKASGISAGMLRISCGLEYPEDLWMDLKNSLNA